MEKTQKQLDKEARQAAYDNEYSEQLRLQGYIRALEADNENIRDSMKAAQTGRATRRGKKLIRINDRDIKLYKKMLSNLPEVLPFS